MIRLKIIGRAEIEAFVQYLQIIEQHYQNEQYMSTKINEKLMIIAFHELIERLIEKIKIKQLQNKVKISVSLLKIEAVLLISHNNLFAGDIFKNSTILSITSELNNQLINSK